VKIAGKNLICGKVVEKRDWDKTDFHYLLFSPIK